MVTDALTSLKDKVDKERPDFLTPHNLKDYLYKLIFLAKYVNMRGKVMACRRLKILGK